MLGAEARLELLRWRFPRLEERTSGAVREAPQERLCTGAVVPGAGCSSGTWLLQLHRSRQRFLVGTDICRPLGLPHTPLVLADLSHALFADASLDLIVCHTVIEHLAQLLLTGIAGVYVKPVPLDEDSE